MFLFSMFRRRISSGVLIGVLVVSIVPCTAHGQASQQPHILLANDDGIDAPGLAVLAQALAAVGHVTVFAPSTNRSGSSMAVDVRGPVLVERVMRDGQLFGYSVGTTPAGAMLIGLEHELGTGQPIDLVVSGINRGANVGDLAHFSGTVGAAMIGAYSGVPAVAVSADARAPDYELSARVTVAFIQQLLQHGPAPGTVYSINGPSNVAADSLAMVVAPMGGSYMRLGFDVNLQDSTAGAVLRFREGEAPVGTDTDQYSRGRVTVTPLRFDWTDYAAFRDLQAWDLRVPALTR